MSFNVDMGSVYQQFANVFGSIAPMIWPFIGATLAIFVFGGLMFVIRQYQGR